MTEPRKIKKVIESYERLTSSVNGNPRFRLTFTDGMIADTMSDAMYCYAVGNSDMREGSTVTITLSRAGKIRTMEGV